MILARARPDTINDFLSPPLILVTPFISFIKHNDYSYTAPELWICVAGLVAFGLLCGAVMALGGTWLRVLGTAGLLTLFVDLQFDWLDTMPHLRVSGVLLGAILVCWLAREHLSRIVAPVFATMLVSTVALYALGGAASSSPARTQARVESAPASDLPTIVHIILDEHIGIEGIPADIPRGQDTKTLLKSFFRLHGFRLFGRAYSRYVHTRNAVPNMLNYTSEPFTGSWVAGDKKAAVLKANKYFEDMHRAGYEIHAFQITALDLCKPSERLIASCRTEDTTGIKGLEETKFSLERRSTLIYQNYFRLSVINSALNYLNRLTAKFAERNGWNWPKWWAEGVGMPAIHSMYTLSIISDEVARSRAGQLFVAHLLLPHNPYIFDARCIERDPADWERASDRAPLPANTAQSRVRRYGLYLEQVQCLYKKLDDMFEKWKEAGVFDRSEIIIHGDHGSRIYRHTSVEEMVDPDYVDAFSTLLAVKAPDYEPGYDLRPIAIQDVLPQLAMPRRPRQMAQGEPARLSRAEPAPYVFLGGGGPGPMIRRRLPSFGDPGFLMNHSGAQ